MGAAAASMGDVGIDDDFIKQVRDKVTPGTSALFALTSDGVPDKIAEAFRGVQGELLHTNLSAEQENQLREVFEDAHAVRARPARSGPQGGARAGDLRRRADRHGRGARRPDEHPPLPALPGPARGGRGPRGADLRGRLLVPRAGGPAAALGLHLGAAGARPHRPTPVVAAGPARHRRGDRRRRRPVRAGTRRRVPRRRLPGRRLPGHGRDGRDRGRSTRRDRAWCRRRGRRPR